MLLGRQIQSMTCNCRSGQALPLRGGPARANSRASPRAAMHRETKKAPGLPGL